MISHLGVNIKEKPTNRINKEQYLLAKPEFMRHWTEDHYPIQRLKAGINFDANIEFFNSIDKEEFELYLQRKVKKHKFKEITNLNELKGISGIYMMVLDEYKQVYIGISTDIKKRILGHWSAKKSLERLIYGDVCNSVLSIDSFGALDTTRVFCIQTNRLYLNEEKIVDDFEERYTLNPTGGGIGSSDTYTDGKTETVMALIATRKGKDLTSCIDVSEFQRIIIESGETSYYTRKYPQLFE